MINQQLVIYIRSQIAKGIPLDVIKINLRQGGGWNDSDISEAFSTIGFQQKADEQIPVEPAQPPQAEMTQRVTPVNPPAQVFPPKTIEGSGELFIAQETDAYEGHSKKQIVLMGVLILTGLLVITAIIYFLIPKIEIFTKGKYIERNSTNISRSTENANSASNQIDNTVSSSPNNTIISPTVDIATTPETISQPVTNGYVVYYKGTTSKNYGQCDNEHIIVASDQGKVVQDIPLTGSWCMPGEASTNFATGLTVFKSSKPEVSADYQYRDKLEIFYPGKKIKEILLDNLLSTFIISPKGDYILVDMAEGGLPQIDMYKADGTFVKNLVPAGAPELGRNFFPIFWSKDESKVFVGSTASINPLFQADTAKLDIFSVNIKTGIISKTQIPQIGIEEAVPSPNSDLIVGTNSLLGMLAPNESLPFIIFSIDVNSGVKKVLATDPKVAFSNIKWSPEGRKILFLKAPSTISETSMPSSTKDVYIMDVSTSISTHISIPGATQFIREADWISENKITFVTDPRGGLTDKSILYSVDIYGKNIKKIDESRRIQILGSVSGKF
jgi:hypothetical protein